MGKSIPDRAVDETWFLPETRLTLYSLGDFPAETRNECTTWYSRLSHPRPPSSLDGIIHHPGLKPKCPAWRARKNALRLIREYPELARSIGVTELSAFAIVNLVFRAPRKVGPREGSADLRLLSWERTRPRPEREANTQGRYSQFLRVPYNAKSWVPRAVERQSVGRRLRMTKCFADPLGFHY